MINQEKLNQKQFTKEDLEKFAEQIKSSGFPLEHWASSLLRKDGWSVTTNRYYVDSDDKKPREMDIVAFKITHLERFKIRTTLLVSCKKSQNSVWGFLRRSFPEYGNQINLFPVMITSNYSPVNYSLRDWGWPREFCKFMEKEGLSNWFGVPQFDVFAHQQIPEKGKLHDSDMHSATMQLIKAQAYEMADHNRGGTREITQFNLISLTEGNFVAFNFRDDDAIEPIQISDQVALTSYKIDNCDHESRILYLTKKSFEENISYLTKLHTLNVKFFGQKEEEFLSDAIFDSKKRGIYDQEFNSNIERYILACTQSFSTPPYTTPKLQIQLSVEESSNPVVEIFANNSEVLEAAGTPSVKEQISKNLHFFWGYDGDFDIKIINDDSIRRTNSFR